MTNTEIQKQSEEYNIIGRNALIAQLKYMKEYNYIQDNEPEQWIKELIKEFNIPDNLVLAFVAYAEEFLQEPFGCLNESGSFWRDEDVLLGVIEKYKVFYEPLLEYVCSNYDYNNSRTVIEPSYEDTTVVCIILNNKCILLEDIKAWHLWHRPKDIISVLATTVKSMKYTIQEEIQ